MAALVIMPITLAFKPVVVVAPYSWVTYALPQFTSSISPYVPIDQPDSKGLEISG